MGQDQAPDVFLLIRQPRRRVTISVTVSTEYAQRRLRETVSDLVMHGHVEGLDVKEAA